MLRSYRQRNFPFQTAVGPVGAGGVFLEEWDAQGITAAGGSYASLRGLYGLPPRWLQQQPLGDGGPSTAPAISSEQQMLWLAAPAMLEDDEEEFRWNSAVSALPAPPAGDYAYQIDCSYRVGLFDALTANENVTPKAGAIGLILGNDSLLAPGWPSNFYFSNTALDAGETETQPEIWTDATSVDEVSAGNSDSFMLTYLTLLLLKIGADTRILTYSSTDGIGKALIADQLIEDLSCTQIGFAVRTERPAVGDFGLAGSGWFDYVRVRLASEGELGTVTFGQTGGRNW